MTTKLVTPKAVKRMRELREQGMSYLRIASEVGWSEYTVRYWTNDDFRERRNERKRQERREVARPRNYVRNLTATALVLSLYMTPSTSRAHEWYSTSCCSGIDCMPVEDGFIRETADGYVISSTGELIPYSDPRIKMIPPQHDDGMTYHWCRRLRDVPPTAWHKGFKKDSTICIYVPGRGA